MADSARLVKPGGGVMGAVSSILTAMGRDRRLVCLILPSLPGPGRTAKLRDLLIFELF